ncbi:MAG: histidinol-phosphatase [Clostridia bacterium]|nr:histidinol-phosphatase [Clostridia bacterium]
MIYDSHVHTVLSCDADTTIAQAICAAENKGVGIVVTDHLDVEFPAPLPDFRLDVDRMFLEYSPLRSERVLLGVELGMTESSIGRCREIAASYPFDFVLGSVHVLDGREVDDALYADRDEAEVYREYLTEAARLVEAVDVDALAHIDYPLRTTSRELPFADYAAEFGALFAAMLRQNVCLELNTSRLADGAAYANLLAIYRAYLEAGGRYVTLGSDAHEPQEIADNFGAAAAFLTEAGLIPVHFCQRKMIIDK